MVATDIAYWDIQLKTYLSNFAHTLCVKEKFGDTVSDCCWINAIMAARLIDIIECYNVNSTTNCLQQTDLYNLFQTASKIINSETCC